MAALWKRLASIVSILLAIGCLVWTPAWAQDDDEVFDFWLSEAFVRRLAQENTINFTMRLFMDARTSKVHTIDKDCEIHIAARAAESPAWPAGVVVEPPNLCKERAPGMPSGSEKNLREVLWPNLLDAQVMGRDCDVVGFPRIFTEHASGNTDAANPNHVLEIHPALGLTCGAFSLDMRSFLKVYPGMRKIQDQTTATCFQGRRLHVRKRPDRYEFREDGGGSCGNFAVVQATINPAWVRKINGGHSAVARVSPGGFGPFTVKLYTHEGTPEDQLLAAFLAGAGPGRRLHFHGMLTYDYFSIVKTLRTRAGVWQDPPDWTEVRFPLAFVIFGEVEVEEE